MISASRCLPRWPRRSWPTRVPGPEPRRRAGGGPGRRGTVAQVPLGALTVAFDLRPLLVMSHFLLAMAVVAASTWVTVRASRLAHGGEPRPLDAPRVGVAAWTAVAACLVRRSPPARSSPPRGRTPAARTSRSSGSATSTTPPGFHVRAAVIFSMLFVIVAVWLWRKARGSVPQRLSVAGVVLTLCQLAVGEYQYRNGLPWRDRRARCHRGDARGHGRHRCGARTRFCS